MEPARSPAVHRHGDVLAGRYRLLQPLAEGGMGSVWSARSLGLGIDVAVKVVKRSVASPWACERLLAEARAGASLAHPSIVRMLDCGTTEDGEPFLVMQLLHGKTLGAWLRERGRLPATVAVQLVLPIVGALVEAHALGIVHRDIKPENIVLEEGSGGRIVPTLVDFGIAKQSRSDTPCFTQSGVLMGSPAYMSPEQARGDHQVDARSDIWSLSVVLYEMITGRRPFEGPNHGAILFAVFADLPTSTNAQGAGDAALWEVLLRGLAKTQAARWQSMSQLGHALAAWAAARGVTADSAGASISHRWLGDDGAGHVVESGQPTTDLSSPGRSSAPPDVASPADTLSSPSSGDDVSHREPEAIGPSSAARPVFGLAALLLGLTALLTFLAASAGAPVASETIVGSPAVAAPAIPPAMTTSAAEATVTAVMPLAGSARSSAAGALAGPLVPMSSAQPSPARKPSPATRAPPTVRHPTGRAPMPLPGSPDF